MWVSDAHFSFDSYHNTCSTFSYCCLLSYFCRTDCILGHPGVGIGKVKTTQKNCSNPYLEKKFLHIPGQVYSQNLRNRLDLSSSTEGPDTEDNNYLGYSLAIGDFTGSGRADLAVGMPRSANLTGKVKSCSKITSRYNHYHILRWCCLPGSDCSICTTWQVAKSDRISAIQSPFWMPMETA